MDFPALIVLTLSTYNAIQQAYRTYFVVFGILAIGAIGYLLFSAKYPATNAFLL